jgi:hypothetical protein
MYTLFTLFKLIFQLGIALVSFAIFVAFEIYVVSIFIELLHERGITGEFLGLSYDAILWITCMFLIVLEGVTFTVNYIWRNVVGRFKQLFSLD